MKKILLSLALCFIFTMAMLVSWNWAPQFAQLTHCPTWVFDAIATVCLFAALITSCLCNEGIKELKEQNAL